MDSNNYISPNAEIKENVFIGNNVRILGNTTIGSNCFIEDNVTIGYPSKSQLTDLINRENIPKDLADLDKYSEKVTIISDNCCIRFGSFISTGAHIGKNVYLDFNTQIGALCKIGQKSQLLYGTRLYYQVSIGESCRVGGFLCNNCLVEDNVSTFGELIHSYRVPIGGINEPSPTIRKGATIGWHALIIGETEVGENAYVGAGAIVTRDVAANSVVIGSRNEIIPFDKWHGDLNKYKP